MIMTLEELRQLVKTDETDAVLEGKLRAMETLIRKYTNNNFKVRKTACIADVVGGMFETDDKHLFEAGDTVQLDGSDRNDGLFTVTEVTGTTFKVKEKVRDDIDLLVTLVQYPADVKMGVVNLMKWDMENRDKAGIASETISRHTVSYVSMDASNSSLGYPAYLTQFLDGYKKARFGQGLSV